MANNLKRTQRTSSEAGFSLLQLIMVMAIAGVIATYAVFSIRSSRESLALQNSVRQLASNIEKARLDALKRHANTSVVFPDTTAYDVTMDFDGTGTPYTRRYALQGGVVLPAGPLPNISFNWRGRTLSCTKTFSFVSPSGLQSWVDVSDAGDVTVNSDVDVLPTVSYATVSTTAGVASTAVVTGTTAHNNSLDCDTVANGTPGPPVTGNGSGGCKLIVNPSSLSIKKNGATTGSIVVTSNTAGTITTSVPINLRITPATAPVSANGSVSFTISSLNTTRGTYAVNFSTSCTTVTSLVKVTN